MTGDTPSPVPTTDERVMAALAHFFGLIAAVIIWVVNKDKSRFVRFQALQALALNGLWALVMLGLMFCLMILMMVGVGLGMSEILGNPTSSDTMTTIMLFGALPWGMFLCIVPFSLVYTLISLIASISVATGHDFRYPVIGRQVEVFLKNG